MNNRYVGTLFSIDSALYKITELTSLGYREEQITAVAHTDDDMAQLRKQTAVPVEGREAKNFLTRFTELFVNDEQKTFEDMGFSKTEAENIYNEMKDGGIALFVEDLEPDGQSGLQPLSDQLDRDSSAAMTDSGEILSDDEDIEPRDANSESVPRVNTNNL